MGKRVLPFVLALLLVGCSDYSNRDAHDLRHEGQIVRVPAAWNADPTTRQWSDFTRRALDELGADLVSSTPRDVTEYCPAYPSLDKNARAAFWISLISELAYLESALKPESHYQERFNDRFGRPVVSRGLLQLSIESGNGNYHCGLQDEQELHDPETNLRCGVRVLNRLVGQRYEVLSAQRADGKWTGAAAYWSPFRSESKRQQIARVTREQAVCKL